MRYCEKCEFVITDNVTYTQAYLIIGGFLLIAVSVCWSIPLCFYYINAIDKNKKLPLVYKIIVLIFVNIIAGILLFFRKEDEYVLS